MLRTYLKGALRNFSKHRTYTFINITGLALGMFCCLLIMLWVQDELTFDKFHKNSDHLYLVVHQQESGWWSSSPWAITPILKKDFPEIEKASRFSTENLSVKYKEHVFHENISFVDPDFLEMFTFPLLEGDPSLALKDKQSVVISQQAAQKYFPGENPVGKTLQIDQNTLLTVTGILKDIPANSSITFDMLVPIKNLGEERLSTWSSEAPAFVLLQENADVENLRTKMAGTQNKYDKRMDNSQVINDLYQYSRLNLYGLDGGGSILYVYIFSVIGLIVLIIACINFINLFTAKASIRSKEIGMRKIVGASKGHIIRQLYGEAFLIAVFSFILAFTLVSIILPEFNVFSEKQISLSFTDNPALIFGSIFLVVLTTFFAGSYPALLFSSISPLNILTNSIKAGQRKSPMRRTLLVIQFSVSIILIVMAITMNRQFDYIQNKSMGFNREQVISLSINEEFRKQLEGIKEHLLQHSGIIKVTSAMSSPNSIDSYNPVYWEGRGPDQYESMNYVVVDHDYLETFEIDLLEGRNFSKDFSTDQQSYIVNEAAVDFMKMDSPIGKIFSVWESEGKIIGVVKDFHSTSLHNEIPPLVMTLKGNVPPSLLFIRVKPDNVKASLAAIENTWKEFMPDSPFHYEFLDDVFRRQYLNEEKTKTLFLSFSVLAIFISCIGLFGLATFITQRRIKEIGIRRANGAKIHEVLLMLNKYFMKWVALSFVIATPFAWYAMNRWLEDFAYKTQLSWWIFALAGLLALGIALLTVSWQSWKAATKNPVEALQYQ